MECSNKWTASSQHHAIVDVFALPNALKWKENSNEFHKNYYYIKLNIIN